MATEIEHSPVLTSLTNEYAHVIIAEVLIFIIENSYTWERYCIKTERKVRSLLF